jgi:hypothetical protein
MCGLFVRGWGRGGVEGDGAERGEGEVVEVWVGTAGGATE